jgi:hypothetical protein
MCCLLLALNFHCVVAHALKNFHKDLMRVNLTLQFHANSTERQKENQACICWTSFWSRITLNRTLALDIIIPLVTERNSNVHSFCTVGWFHVRDCPRMLFSLTILIDFGIQYFGGVRSRWRLNFICCLIIGWFLIQFAFLIVTFFKSNQIK